MSTTVEVPESQRLIAVSLGKIAASRGQKGGINLHKNLLVATVLHKARTAYMIQQFARQRASQSPPPQPTATSPPPPANVEMREQPSEVAEPSSTTTTTTTTASSPSSPSAAAPTFPIAAPSSPAAPPSAGVAPPSESGSVPDGAAVSSVQVAESEDKENTPPPSPSHGDAEKRLQGDNKNTSKDCADKNATLSKPHVVSVTQTQKSTRDYVSKGCSSCLLKRRRAMASDHENVSAPKVRIVDTRLSQQQQQQDSTPEPMQCDSPQISNLVNIFNASFAGLSGAGAESSVRSVVGQSVLSVATHKMSDSNVATCAKEMKVGLDSVRQPLVLSV